MFVGVSLGAVSPVPCPDARLLPAYAHNDYRNTNPLQDALEAGYRGVEVDVLFSGGELLVGHDRSELRRGRDLTSLYLDPLQATFRRCGRIIRGGDALLLTLELKSRSSGAFHALLEVLERYPELFRHDSDGRDPPVRVVLVGWWPGVNEGPAWPEYLRIQWDARNAGPVLEARRVGLVSLDYGRAFDWKGRGDPPAQDVRLLARAARLADSLGVPCRVHQAPPSSAVYRWLLEGGVHLIGVKDLRRGADLLRERAE